MTPSLPLRKRTMSKSQPDLSSSNPKILKETRTLAPAPFFYYRDHSREPDDDPFIPLTLPGKTPNFPARMHAILANPELDDVIEWMPHGRSWRILKTREFEMRVLPRYFEHSKFSSFVRQTNGWGFRRVTQGTDRGCYYHEYFLRSLPHLCKKMKRHGVAKKTVINAEHEPDFHAISRIYPVPFSTSEPQMDELAILENVIEEGPRARMPVRYDAIAKASTGHAEHFSSPLISTSTKKKLKVETPNSDGDTDIPKVTAYISQAGCGSLKDPINYGEDSSNSYHTTEEETCAHNLTLLSSSNMGQNEQSSTSLNQTKSHQFTYPTCNPILQEQLALYHGIKSTAVITASSPTLYNSAVVASHLNAAASHLQSAIHQTTSVQQVAPLYAPIDTNTDSTVASLDRSVQDVSSVQGYSPFAAIDQKTLAYYFGM